MDLLMVYGKNVADECYSRWIYVGIWKKLSYVEYFELWYCLCIRAENDSVYLLFIAQSIFGQLSTWCKVDIQITYYM